MDRVFYQKLDLSMERLVNFGSQTDGLQLETPEQRVAKMFLEIVLDPRIGTTVAPYVGIEVYERMSNCTTLDELATLIPDCNIFKVEFEDNFRLLKTIVESWNANLRSDGLNVEAFLKACIIAMSEKPDLFSRTDQMKVDQAARERLCLKYGIEI